MTDQSDLPVGSVVSEPVEFTNLGGCPAATAQVLLSTSPGLTFADHYANCKYSSVPDHQVAEEALCTFPGPVQVGEHVALATPARLLVGPDAYSTYLDAYTAPKGDPFMQQDIASRIWKQGKGATLELTVLDPGQPGTAPAGQVTSSSLTLRVDTVIPGAADSVAMNWGSGSRPAYDTDAANDSATLTLN